MTPAERLAKRTLDEVRAATNEGEAECDWRLERVARALREPTQDESIALDDPAFKGLALLLLDDTRLAMRRTGLTAVEAAKTTPVNDALQTMIEWLIHNID